MRVVVDTNIIISSIFWGGAPYEIIRLGLDGKIEICSSTSILNEVRKVLQDPKEKFKLSEEETNNIIQTIRECVSITESKEKVTLSRDPKDDHILECAATSKATFIVTRDNELLVLKEYLQTKIISPNDFLHIIRN